MTDRVTRRVIRCAVAVAALSAALPAAAAAAASAPNSPVGAPSLPVVGNLGAVTSLVSGHNTTGEAQPAEVPSGAPHARPGQGATIAPARPTATPTTATATRHRRQGHPAGRHIRRHR